jgi:cytochrome c-type biogenesis protein CcmH
MALWIVFAVLTALATLAVMRPYLRQKEGAGAAGPRDIEIYKQQLREVEDECARGMLGEAEAQAARVEISRRILALSDEKPADGGAAAPAGRAVPYVMAGALVLLTIGIYVSYGSPGLPGQPLSRRAAPTMDSAAVRLEKYLQANPGDARGWAMAGGLYIRLGRFADAVKAHRKAMTIAGETPAFLANLGEALTYANKGVVPAEARGLFEKAVGKDENNIKAGFWLGAADEQAGKFADAASRYRKLLKAELPENVKKALRERLAKAEKRASGTPQTRKSAAARDMSIEAMVGNLAERLKANSSDLTGWLMLIRSYMVLGRRDDAEKALKDARGNFTDNTEALGQIDALAKSLGLAS